MCFFLKLKKKRNNKMYLLLFIAQFYWMTNGYLYSGHDYSNLYSNQMQNYYSDTAHRQPSAPQFINQPPAQVIFFNESNLALPCPAYATPKATIKWFQPTTFDVNSYLLYNNTSSSIFNNNNDNNAILRYQRADGSLVFTAHSLLNGQSTNGGYKSIFQCSATNKYGTTLSRPVKVKAGK